MGHHGGYWVANKDGRKSLYAAYPGKQGQMPKNYVTYEVQRGQQIVCSLDTEEEMEPYKREAFNRLMIEINGREDKAPHREGWVVIHEGKSKN